MLDWLRFGSDLLFWQAERKTCSADEADLEQILGLADGAMFPDQ